jgi:hypothetical protein
MRYATTLTADRGTTYQHKLQDTTVFVSFGEKGRKQLSVKTDAGWKVIAKYACEGKDNCEAIRTELAAPYREVNDEVFNRLAEQTGERADRLKAFAKASREQFAPVTMLAAGMKFWYIVTRTHTSVIVQRGHDVK